jgi:hypothetical protein
MAISIMKRGCWAIVKCEGPAKCRAFFFAAAAGKAEPVVKATFSPRRGYDWHGVTNEGLCECVNLGIDRKLF